MTAPQDSRVLPFPRTLEAAQRRAARQYDQIQAAASETKSEPPRLTPLSAVLLGVLVLSLIGVAVVLLIALPLWAAFSVITALLAWVKSSWVKS